MEKTFEEVRACIEELVPFQFASACRIHGGGNNQIWQVTLADGREVVCKFYFVDPRDKRNRLKTEFQATKYLWDKGIRNIPEPILSSDTHHCALYSFIRGDAVRRLTLGDGDVHCAVEFATQLFKASKFEEASKLPNASEACFSLDEILASVKRRLQILQSVPATKTEINDDFRDFVSHSLCRRFEELRNATAGSDGNDKSCLEQSRRTLSPSDFGFHNALRHNTGNWTFLDFEYFGWDDPAKMISDFMMHPGMNLSENHGKLFLREMLPIFDDNDLLRRLRTYLPLFGLKWCCIVLNEFVPEYRARRGFSGISRSASDDQVLTLQLAKGRKLFEQFCCIKASSALA